MNLTIRGEWGKAEIAYKRALKLATEAKHVHAAGILDSLGELKILRGELAEAQDLLEQSVALAGALQISLASTRFPCNKKHRAKFRRD